PTWSPRRPRGSGLLLRDRGAAGTGSREEGAEGEQRTPPLRGPLQGGHSRVRGRIAGGGRDDRPEVDALARVGRECVLLGPPLGGRRHGRLHSGRGFSPAAAGSTSGRRASGALLIVRLLSVVLHPAQDSPDLAHGSEVVRAQVVTLRASFLEVGVV